MFIVNEPENLKISGTRNKLMESIDTLIPEFDKEFTLSNVGDKKVVVCELLDKFGKKVISFTAENKSFTDSLQHIRRQIRYYDVHNENFYPSGGNDMEEENKELLARMTYETSCRPKRKDHRELQIEWCKKIDEITPDKNYYEFYKNTDIRKGFIVTCRVTNYKYKGGERLYVSRKSSCIEGLRDIYKQIRDLL